MELKCKKKNWLGRCIKKKSSNSKNNFSDYLSIILTFVGILIIAGVFVYGGVSGWFRSSNYNAFGNISIIELFNQKPSVGCTFIVDDTVVCVGDDVTGTINAKSPVCYVGYNYNNEGWKFAGIINEQSPGLYQESRQATVIGNYLFAAICGTPSDFCRTNDVEVDVISCDEDEEDCDYTCGWVGEQCGGTCPTDYPLCVDMWYDNDALFGEGGYVFCGCINPDTEEVHPDWKPGEKCHDDSGLPSEGCEDTDPTQDIYLFGTCTPISGIAEPDFCPTPTAVTQLWCSSDGTSCMGASSICPDGEICIGGVCVEQLEYKDNIDPSEAIPGLVYGEPDMDGCVASADYVELCKTFVDPEVDSAHCEGDTTRMIDCSEGWNNCGGGEGEGDWYCCNFQNIDTILNDHCCGDSPFCDVVCERWYQAGV
ncbi:MAG: hypothetical protein KKE05_05085 [Nanoarchaeota archaeon]|nr:hypothetical protein [Nanoarchaeota archaeon]